MYVKKPYDIQAGFLMKAAALFSTEGNMLSMERCVDQ